MKAPLAYFVFLAPHLCLAPIIRRGFRMYKQKEFETFVGLDFSFDVLLQRNDASGKRMTEPV
jgi:hypothetical protein